MEIQAERNQYQKLIDARFIYGFDFKEVYDSLNKNDLFKIIALMKMTLNHIEHRVRTL